MSSFNILLHNRRRKRCQPSSRRADLPALELWVNNLKYNILMNPFKYHYPIDVRFGDLDAFWHVNNARFLVYLEDARSRYLQEMCLLDGKALWQLPIIVGDIHIRYRQPIELGHKVVVSMGATRISAKTVTFEYQITGEGGTPLHATAESIMVCYDYETKKTVPLSDELRRKFSEREGREL